MENLYGMCVVLLAAAETLELQTGWLEGCACHETVLHGPNGSVRRFQQSSRGCPWKGRRGPEMVHDMPKVVANIQCHMSEPLKRCIQESSPPAAAALVGYHERARHKLAEVLPGKLAFWHALPFKLVGVIYHLRGGAVSAARACAQECVSEYDEALAEGKALKLHRVAHLLLGESSGQVAVEIRAFAEGIDDDLGQSAYQELRAYAMVPLASRKVEAPRAKVKRFQRSGTTMAPPLINVLMKRPQLAQLSEDESFIAWATKQWNKNNLANAVLKCAFGEEDACRLGTWTQKQVAEHPSTLCTLVFCEPPGP